MQGLFYIPKFQNILAGILLLFCLTFISSFSYAACTNPAGDEGTLTYNNSENVLQLCDGTSWRALGPTGVATGGGCTNPTGVRGELIYSSSYHVPQYCNSTDWIALGPVNDGETQIVPIDTAASDWFGEGVTIRGDLVVVGAPLDDDGAGGGASGSVHIYDTSHLESPREIINFIGDNTDTGDWFGWSVDVSGNLLISGARIDDSAGSQSGAALFFDISDPSNPVEQSEVFAANPQADSLFGHSVAISGDVAMVGEPWYDVTLGPNTEGRAYVFDISDPENPVRTLIEAPGGTTNDAFGWDVDVSGNLALISMHLDDDNGFGNSGSVFIFDVTTPSSPVQQAKFYASDPEGSAHFGEALAIDGNIAVVGALIDNYSGITDSGSVYIFDVTDPANPVEKAKIGASDAAVGDQFGQSVAINGNIVVVGADLGDGNVADSGAAYVFDITDLENPVELVKLIASDGAANDEFGNEVAVSDSRIVVGARLDDGVGADSGSVYVFDLALTGMGCSAPSGTSGEITYNTSAKALQYCDGARWQAVNVVTPPAGVYASCKEILDAGYSIGNGVYNIDVDGAGGQAAFDVYCDMQSSGGGWTMVVAQFENDPVTNWNEGIQGDYDPSLATSKGFALSTAQIPSHTQTAFGQGVDATVINYVDYVYTTGNIAKTLLSGLKNTNNYHIHRNTLNYHHLHDPESATVIDAQWNDSLTFDKTGGISYTWAFSPEHGTARQRGFAMKGSHITGSNQSYAWTVWVR